MNNNPRPHLPRQQRLAFTKNKIGPRLPPEVDREVCVLLARMLVEVVRLESHNEKEGVSCERQDPR